MNLKLFHHIFNWLGAKFDIPPIALRMFKASNDISGIDKRTLPTELIPLNSIQLSRGLLNYTVIQSRLNWLLPFWAVKQYNPESKSFIPRSHLGLSMNLTNRNWTAVGNPECNLEPIVDPRGMITPFVNGWSIDIWLQQGKKIFFPSKEKNVKQSLVNDLPIVKTEYLFEKIKAEAIVSVKGKKLQIKICAEGCSENQSLIIAIRPFNPEGISLLNTIEFKDDFFLIDKEIIEFDKHPDFIYCSNFECGDSSNILEDLENHEPVYSTYCKTGLANAVAVFNFKDNLALNISCILEKDNSNSTFPEPEEYWLNLLKQGTEIITPDEKLNSILKSSISTVLLFCDEKIITPGPFTYHQFWFRDAAYMLYALDRFGFHNFSKRIIETFANRQDKNGYFRSQKGEWDSNGQAVWTNFQHAILTDDISFLQSNFDSLLKGIEWIDKARIKDPSLRGKNVYGLLPKGLSAEHVGLADYYFWDNFWSLAGIKSFIIIAEILNKHEVKTYAQSLLKEYENDVILAIKNVQKKYKTNSITSSATRGIDCGIIGSICASYPLQLFAPEDTKILLALDILADKYFYKGMFFQHFIHSGMNSYLTMQIAHSYLYSGRREKFTEIFNSVIDRASPTNNFPEAIHPTTGGGCMGDGHHGWAASEILLAAADAFAYEYENEIYLLAGIPVEWFDEGKTFSIKNLKLKAGTISINCLSDQNEIKLGIIFEKNKLVTANKFIIKIPLIIEMPQLNCSKIKFENGESIVTCSPFSIQLNFFKSTAKATNTIQQSF